MVFSWNKLLLATAGPLVFFGVEVVSAAASSSSSTSRAAPGGGAPAPAPSPTSRSSEEEQLLKQQRSDRKEELRKLVLSALEFKEVVVKMGRDFRTKAAVDPTVAAQAEKDGRGPTPWVTTYPAGDSARDTRAWLHPMGIFNLQTVDGFNAPSGGPNKLQIFLVEGEGPHKMDVRNLEKHEDREHWKQKLREAGPEAARELQEEVAGRGGRFAEAMAAEGGDASPAEEIAGKVIRQVVWNNEVIDVLNIPEQVMRDLRNGLGHKLLDLAKTHPRKKKTVGPQGQQQNQGDADVDVGNWRKVFAILQRHPEMVNFNGNGARYTVLMQAAIQNELAVCQALVEDFFAATETGGAGLKLRSLRLENEVRDFLFPQDKVTLTFENSLSSVNREVSVELPRVATALQLQRTGAGAGGAASLRDFEVDVKELRLLVARALEVPSVKILDPVTLEVVEDFYQSLPNKMNLHETLSPTESARPVFIRREPRQERLLYKLVVEGYDDTILKELRTMPYTTVKPSTRTNTTDELFQGAHFDLKAAWNGHASCLGCRGEQNQNSPQGFLQGRFLPSSRSSGGAGVEQDDEQEHLDKLKTMGVVISMAGERNSYDRLYSEKKQENSIVYTANGATYLAMYADALAQLFPKLADFGSTTQEAEMIFQQARRTLETVATAVFREKLGAAAESTEKSFEKAVWLRSLKDIVEKLYQAVVEDHRSDGEKDRVQVIFNVECSDSQQPYKFEDIATVITFGMTFQIGDLALKRLLERWQSIPRGQELRKVDAMLGQNPFILSAAGISGEVLLQSEMHSSASTTAAATGTRRPASSPVDTIEDESTFIEGNRQILNGVMPLLGAMFHNPELSAFETFAAGGTVIFNVKSEFLPDYLKPVSEVVQDEARKVEQGPAGAAGAVVGSSSAVVPPPPVPHQGATSSSMTSEAQLRPYDLQIISSVYFKPPEEEAGSARANFAARRQARENARNERRQILYRNPDAATFVPDQVLTPSEKVESATKDHFKRLGEKYEDSEKHPAHVVLFYKQFPKVAAGTNPSTSAFGPQPGQFLAAMTHFINLKELNWVSYQQLYAFFQTLLSEEEFEQWEARRKEEYAKKGMPHDKLYPSDNARASLDGVLAQAGGRRRDCD